MEKVLVTHNDFDGAVCAVLFKAVFPDGVYYLENYSTVDGRVREVIKTAPTHFFVADISFSEETAERFNCAVENQGAITGVDPLWLLIDHHKTAIPLKEKYGWAVVDTSRCGAAIFFELLRMMGGQKRTLDDVLLNYRPLVCLANDYDLWLHKDPHSSVINSLLYAIGQERFIKRFLANPSIKLTPEEEYLLEIEREKEEKYVREAVEAAKVSGQYAVTMAERLASQIEQKLLEAHPDVDIAAIVNAQKGVVSLRSRKTDVSEIAGLLGGGGHPHAAGFTLPKHLFHHEILDLLMEAMGV